MGSSWSHGGFWWSRITSSMMWRVSLNAILDSSCRWALCIILILVHSFIWFVYHHHSWTTLQYNSLGNWHFPLIHKAHQVHIGSCFVSGVLQANTLLSWSSGTLASPLSWQPLHSAPTWSSPSSRSSEQEGQQRLSEGVWTPVMVCQHLASFFPSNNMTNQ